MNKQIYERQIIHKLNTCPLPCIHTTLFFFRHSFTCVIAWLCEDVYACEKTGRKKRKWEGKKEKDGEEGERGRKEGKKERKQKRKEN